MKTKFVCQQCGFETTKWLGKCPECGEWNSLLEEAAPSKDIIKAKTNVIKRDLKITSINDMSFNDDVRFDTGEKELNRVLGGGIVKGSLVLVGGAPGIGKSTLLLQICQYVSCRLKTLYISGEESQRQIKLRAKRLNVENENLFIISDIDIDSICDTIVKEQPGFVIIDSIQTMYKQGITSSPGSVSQIREATNALMRIAKEQSIPIFIVGHINKDGNLAGPKILEHMVDTVLYFEGDNETNYRILRTVKNRFGATNEIGVFDMTDKGLVAVENPSKMMLEGRPLNVSGTSITSMMEGSRPILSEVQALTTPSTLASPRRMSTGLDYSRLAMLLAVLEKRAGIFTSNQDVYVNAVGGLKLFEPATDFAICIALASALRDIPADKDCVAVGEVGLAGEIRSISSIDLRIREAARMGFKRIFVPYRNKITVNENIEIVRISNLKEGIQKIINKGE